MVGVRPWQAGVEPRVHRYLEIKRQLLGCFLWKPGLVFISGDRQK